MAESYQDDEIILTGDSAYGGKSILSLLPAKFTSSATFTPKVQLYSVPRSRRREAREHLERKGNV